MQAITLLPSPPLQADLVGGVVMVAYWPDTPQLNADCLLSPAARAALRPPTTWSAGAAGASAGTGASASSARPAGAQVVLRSGRSNATASGSGAAAAAAAVYPLPAPVEVEHIPRLVDDAGRVLALPVDRAALSI